MCIIKLFCIKKVIGEKMDNVELWALRSGLTGAEDGWRGSLGPKCG